MKDSKDHEKKTEMNKELKKGGHVFNTNGGSFKA